MEGASLPILLGGILLMEFVLKKPIKTMQFTDVKKVDELAEFLKADRVDFNPMDEYIVFVFKKLMGNIGYRVNLYDYVIKMPSGRIIVVDEDEFNYDFTKYEEESADDALTRFRNTKNPLEDTFNSFFKMALEENKRILR